MATKKKPAGKPVKKNTASAKNAKAKAPAKKSAGAKVKPAKDNKKKQVKKAAPKPAAKKAPAKKAVAKKSAPAKPAIKKGSKTVKKTNSKTVSAKSAPAKKPATPAKKAPAPAKKAVVKAPVKKAAPAPAKKAVPAAAKKAAPAPKQPVVKEAKVKEVKEVKVKAPRKAPTPKTPTKTITTFAKTALPNRPSTSTAAAAARSGTIGSKTPLPAPRPAREEKKPAVIVARRVLENKAKSASQGKTMINYQPDYTRSILDEPEMAQGPVYRYSDEELNEFRDLIQGRLEAARKELIYLQGLITRKDEAGTEDTENRYMNMEDGSGAMEREQLAQLASRQIQFINHLEKALMRIENKTYGICRVTGKLIDKARLRAVPHATLSIEAKKTMSNK
jgi:RNA polymerase-binding transcription factor DksA